MHRQQSTPPKHISVSGTHFYYSMSKPQGLEPAIFRLVDSASTAMLLGVDASCRTAWKQQPMHPEFKVTWNNAALPVLSLSEVHPSCAGNAHRDENVTDLFPDSNIPRNHLLWINKSLKPLKTV
jgi:hypothetical protein